MNRRPRSGEIYRHFKDKLYQIVTVAKHSETGEELVIYQALYGDYKCYARPLEMFVSEVDHEKYPNIKQKYRFELKTDTAFEAEEKLECEKEIAHEGITNAMLESSSCEKKSRCDSSIENLHKKVENEERGTYRKVRTDTDAENQRKIRADVDVRNHTSYNSETSWNKQKLLSKTDRIQYMTAEERMMAFFDTDDLEERYKILSSLRDDITDMMIDNMAVVMDIVIEDGNLTKRYDDLKRAIQTKQRYEQNTRLR